MFQSSIVTLRIPICVSDYLCVRVCVHSRSHFGPRCQLLCICIFLPPLNKMALLAIDSTGKTSKCDYCSSVCARIGWLQPIYTPGACLADLIGAVSSSKNHHSTLCIISNANKVVDMNFQTYMQTTRNNMWDAICKLAKHIANNVSKHLILFGSDVDLFEGAKFPKDYRRIQCDVLNMLAAVGLNAGTSMEAKYGGGFGRFQGKLDRNWHIRGVHRWEAENFLEGVLNTLTEHPTQVSASYVFGSDVFSSCPGDDEQASSRTLTEHPTQVSASYVFGSDAFSSCSGDDEQASSRSSWCGLRLMKQNPQKKCWIDTGRERGYRWPRCSDAFKGVVRVVCPVDGEEGTVLVCTSGDRSTTAQARLTCQMLNYLGWRPHIIEGVRQADMPPKSWKKGCKATFAWYVSLMPQILACAEALYGRERLMVAEDSLWPSDLLTPATVHKLCKRKDKALWLAALLQPKKYTHKLGDVIDISAVAAAGSKCFCGDKYFWRNVHIVFDVTDKDWSTDSIFQTMVGLGELELVHPFLGATMPHVSKRTDSVGSHSLRASDVAGTLLPLPLGWEEGLSLNECVVMLYSF